MNADPHLGRPTEPHSNGTPDAYGSSPPPGSASPAESGSGPSSTPHRGPKRSPRRRRVNSSSGPTLAEAAASGWRHVLELGDYVRSLLAARADRAATEMRRKLTKIAIALIAALAAAGIIISASLKLVAGTAEGLALLFGRGAWLGDLAAGILFLGIAALGCALVVSRREKKELEKHLQKYEAHHREHRARHGSFVGDRPPPHA